MARTATEPPNVHSAQPSVIIPAKWVTSKMFVIVRNQEVAEVRVTNSKTEEWSAKTEGSVRVVQEGGQDSGKCLNEYSLYQINSIDKLGSRFRWKWS